MKKRFGEEQLIKELQAVRSKRFAERMAYLTLCTTKGSQNLRAGTFDAIRLTMLESEKGMRRVAGQAVETVAMKNLLSQRADSTGEEKMIQEMICKQKISQKADFQRVWVKNLKRHLLKKDVLAIGECTSC